MNAEQVRQTVFDMLCAETGCDANQLVDDKIHVAVRDPDRMAWPQHRRFNPHPGRIGAVTLGTGAVISVDPTDLDWAESTFTDVDRDELFRDQMLAEFVSHGKQRGLTVHGPYPRFTGTPEQLNRPAHSGEYTVRVADIESELAANPTMIDRAAFPNAVFPDPSKVGRPTVLAAVAEINGEVAGVAGVSKDSEFMYQIGIDVLPAHRGNGLAPAMTAAAARAVFDVGGLPYYGTSSSNVASMRTALAAGLRPTWVEVLTRPA